MDKSTSQSINEIMSRHLSINFSSTSVSIFISFFDEKIKEKRYKLKKILLTTKFNQIDEENFLREKQLKSEQIRVKEFQLNLKILDDHQSKMKRSSFELTIVN